MGKTQKREINSEKCHTEAEWNELELAANQRELISIGSGVHWVIKYPNEHGPNGFLLFVVILMPWYS